jgi:hypothetical protein
MVASMVTALGDFAVAHSSGHKAKDLELARPLAAALGAALGAQPGAGRGKKMAPFGAKFQEATMVGNQERQFGMPFWQPEQRCEK